MKYIVLQKLRSFHVFHQYKLALLTNFLALFLLLILCISDLTKEKTYSRKIAIKIVYFCIDNYFFGGTLEIISSGKM